jgi:uncharacterized coiled-coil DUF342 family protein
MSRGTDDMRLHLDILSQRVNELDAQNGELYEKCKTLEKKLDELEKGYQKLLEKILD